MLAATANRIDLLPAEMLRKGRFDEVFFVDLAPARIDSAHDVVEEAALRIDILGLLDGRTETMVVP